MKKKIEIGFLVVLAGILGYYVYQRLGMRMGGAPSSFQSSFRSEGHWMVETILRDIAEAAAYAHGVPVTDVRLDYELLPAGSLELPTVHVDIAIGGLVEEQHTLTLDRSFWTPENYAALAVELLGPSERDREQATDGAVLETLLQPTPSVLLSESDRVTASLRANIRDPLAHEEAAVLLGVFGMREATYGFEDTRFLLLRMTSHLALARALRGDEAWSMTGRVGEAALLALSGRQAELLSRLDGWSFPPGSRPIEPWRNALYVYSTEDWRHGATSGDLLVELMRFRSMVTSLGASTALERMAVAVEADVADWGRILAGFGSGDVAARAFVEDQVGRELAEAREVSLAYHGTMFSPQELSARLNEHPGGMIGADGPRVIDWGLWAAFYQRHLCGAILAQNRMLRETLGMRDAAEDFGRQTELVFEDLEMNPIVQVRRTRYVGGRVEDTIGMDGVIALTRRYPEMVNPASWRGMEDTAAHMMRKHGMPKAASWLSPRVLVTGALDSTRQRLKIFELEHAIDPAEALTVLSEVAPRHTLVLAMVAERMERERNENTYRELSAQLGERVEFDLYALRNLLDVATLTEDRIEVLERMCALDSNECARLGWELAYAKRDEDAVAAFEQLVKSASSSVHMCNNSNWLVNYYYEHGRRDEALALAEKVAEVYCSWGLRTHAYLVERMGQVARAEQLYVADAERYEYDAPVSPPLLGFYYRRARVEDDAAYQNRFERSLSQVFPNGLEPLPDDAGSTPPTDGALIDGHSGALERAGLRGADVIVGLDGWRVHTLDQYDVVASFRDQTSSASEMQLRIWRQTRYMDLNADVPSRRFGVRMRTFGTPGPSYQSR